MHLTHLQPVRADSHLVGWTARFTDEGGRVRIATLRLGCLMNPVTFTQAVASQGVRFTAPGGTDPAAWQALVRDLMK